MTSPLLTAQEILDAPSGETVLKADGSVDIRASRLARESSVAHAQLVKVVKDIDNHTELKSGCRGYVCIPEAYWQSLKELAK